MNKQNPTTYSLSKIVSFSNKKDTANGKRSAAAVFITLAISS